MISGGIVSGATARNASRWTSGSRTGQPGSPCQVGRSIVAVSVPWASMSDVIVSGPTQVRRAGQMSIAVVSVTSARARSAPCAIWPAGPASTGAGPSWTASLPTRACATAPSGSGETTTTGKAPPDHAMSTRRRTRGWPRVSAMAPSGVADRITAATVMVRC